MMCPAAASDTQNFVISTLAVFTGRNRERRSNTPISLYGTAYTQRTH